jgi:hypothetical protein
MKEFLIKDIYDIQKEQGYKYIGLFDQQGNKVIPFNSNASSSNDRLKEIETRLTSAGLQDGFYNICCKNALKGGTADNYMIKKGENLSESTNANIPIVQTLPPDLLSYAQALKLNVEVERLKLENAAQKKEIENLKKELIENQSFMSEEEEDNTPGMLENAKTFMSEAMGFIAPLLDKHFELKEKQLGLQAVQIQHRLDNSNRTKRPSPEQAGIKDKNLTESFIMNYKDDPEVYEQLATFYNEAISKEQFLNSVKDWNSEIFNDLVQWKQN